MPRSGTTAKPRDAPKQPASAGTKSKPATKPSSSRAKSPPSSSAASGTRAASIGPSPASTRPRSPTATNTIPAKTQPPPLPTPATTAAPTTPTTSTYAARIAALDDTLDLGPPKIRFSGQEIVHLAATVAVLSYALSIVLGPNKYPDRLIPEPIYLLGTTLSVATGFVLHELAHKIAAHRLGFWAEFRAAFLNLLVSLGIAVAPLGFTVAFPGAVHIFGRASRQEAGRIAVVGPLVNLVLAAIALPLLMASHDPSAMFTIFSTVALTNSLLAVFNLLPFGAFDGRKVARWNMVVYCIALFVALGLFGTVLVEMGALQG